MIMGIGIAVAIAVVVVVTILGTWVGRYNKAGPNELLIISGRKRTVKMPDGSTKEVNFRTVHNAGTFVWPFVEKIGKMSLRNREVQVQSHKAMSKEGVALKVNGVAIFKFASDDSSAITAAERYLGNEDEAEKQVRNVLEGHLRGVCGTLTPEEIYRDRQAFQQKIAEHAQAALAQMGIVLDVLTLQEITDENEYLESLGKKRTAEVKRDAAIGQAEATRESTMKTAEATRDGQKRTAETEAEIAEAKKARDVKQQKFNAEVATEKAKAEQAGPKATAEAEKDVVAAQIELTKTQACQREEQLIVDQVKPAEAAKRKTVIEAEAARDSQILRAEGDKKARVTAAEGDKEARTLAAEAENVELTQEGAGEAAKIRNIGQAKGDAAKAEGEGEAAAIRAKLFAEAEGLEKKAEAMDKFNDATMRLEIAKEVIHTLPELVKAAATPLAGVESIKVVDFGGSSGNGSGSPLDRLLGVSPKTIAVADEILRTTLRMSLADMIQLVRKGDIASLTPAAGGAAHTEETARPRHAHAGTEKGE